ncbi:transmembrane amino acid transporter protein-domain-containing protein [Pelagophyceae sp. CCMP2097]|nr:transmembrane amino acid transporter protein-domain-containing protein [Pelagophyceae sp. CCMP2097]
MRCLVVLAAVVACGAFKADQARLGGRKVLGRAEASGRGGAVVAAPAQKSSAVTSTFNLAKNIIGSGVLALPAGVAAFSDSRLALGPAVSLIVVLGVLSAYCFTLVGRACAALGSRTYRGAWERAVGEDSGWLITLLCVFKCLTGCLAYTIILGDTGTSLARTYVGGPLGTIFGRRDALLGILGASVLLPLALLESLAALAPASLLGLAGMLYTTAFCVLRACDGTYAAGGRLRAALPVARLPVFGNAVDGPSALVLVSMLATAYVAHYNAAKYYDELEDRSQFNAVVAGGFGLAIAVFSAVTVAAFFTFGGASAGFILNSYASTDALAAAARAAVGVSVACTYPLLFAGLRDYVYEMAPSLRRFRTPLTAGLVATTVAAGIVLTDLGFVCAFGGAVLGSLVIYVIPTKIVLSAQAKGAMKLSKPELLLCRGLHVLGIGLAALGGAVTLLKQFGRL